MSSVFAFSQLIVFLLHMASCKAQLSDLI